MPHEVGSIIEGKVTGITKFGAFVDLGDGAVGMVHISEVSQSYVNDISEHLQEGQTVKVKVLNVGEDGKISLSIKRAQPRPENANFRRDNNNNRAGGRPQQGNRPNFNNNREGGREGGNFRGNNNNRDGGRRYNDNHSASQQKGPASFEDILAKFMSSSDEKFSDMKQPERSRRRPRNKNYNDYD